MVHPEKKHFIIVGRTLGVQVLLFIGILLAVWGAQKLYTAIDPAKFPAYQVEVKEGMTEHEKGAALLTALTHRLDSELHSTFGWTANDILFSRWVMDNRAYTAAELLKRGFDMTDSYANFLFVKHPALDGGKLYEKLKEMGILVRHFNSSRISDYNRITVGTKAEMDALIAAIDQILKEGL